MENASRALIIAAGLLIAILVISLGVFLFFTMGNYATQVEDINQNNQLQKFNNQFIKYDSANNNNVTIHDIVTVANLAKSNNENESETGYHITVLYKGTRIEDKDEIYLNQLISTDLSSYSGEDTSTLKKYKCKVTIDNKNSRVTQVTFTE